ncbi:MAG: phosphoribosylanthranilate isomerase [Mucilaginibacter sp.]
MKIKVCGLRDPENIKAVAALNPDFMGFIFYRPSPRFVNELQAAALDEIPASVYKTGVFVNEEEDTINELINRYSFDAVQLHGNESPDLCASLQKKAKVIRAFGIHPGFDFDQLRQFENKVDFFLFDTKTDSHGGSGNTFDWSILNKYQLATPFFLSGGLSPANIGEINSLAHPQFYGVDLNSNFELSPGLKDIKKLEEAFNTIKQSDTK